MSRKADREAYAEKVYAIAARFGASVARTDYRKRLFTLNLTLNGVGCQVDVDGGSKCAAYLLSWYSRPARDFNHGFLTAVGDGGEFPHYKAVTLEFEQDVALARLRAGLRKAMRGMAFVEATP